MSTQEEIRDRLEIILADSKGLSYSNVVFNILEYLQSKGVVIQGKSVCSGIGVSLQIYEPLIMATKYGKENKEYGSKDCKKEQVG